jgi:DNA polymerase
LIDAVYLMRQQALKTKPRILIDFESRSVIKLKGKDSPGAFVYAEHPSTRILCMGYQIGDGEVKLWWPFYGEPFPEEVRQAAADGYVFEAHNVGFERVIWRNLIEKQYGVPLPLTWVDTMAACAYRSLPMKLEEVNRVLKLSQQKDKRGDFLIRKLCLPQKLTKKDIKEGKEWPNWCDDPELMREFGEYCKQDIRSEKDLGNAVKDLPPDEYNVWCLDQEINERGVYVDMDAITAADIIRHAVELRLEARLADITDQYVKSGSELDKIKEWCSQQGFPLADMQADTIEIYLEWEKNHGLPPPKNVAEVLRIRQTLSKASAKKIAKFILTRCKDGRIRGMLQYHGASTGRWAGRGVQPQNFPRPDEDLMGKDGEKGMADLIAAILFGDDQMLELFYGDPMAALASALRGFIIAEPGSELYVADFSAIEARVLAWVAGEQWKLDAFAAIDRGEGYKGSQDIYLATASMVFGYPCLTKKTHGKERQTGKTCELAFGYQGGVGAWRKFDPNTKLDRRRGGCQEERLACAHPNIETSGRASKKRP